MKIKLHKMVGILILAAIGVCLMAACSANDEFVAGQNEIIINEGTEWELEGVLTLPEGKKPFPVVVFMHGSGPTDKDGAYGMFLDLANDLAKEGIASIRFDKRTFTYEEVAHDVSITPQEEYLDDVLAAVALAKTIKSVNSEQIFVAGWSRGGFLIPKVYEEDKEDIITGFISLAGKPETDLAEVKQLINQYETTLLNPELSEYEEITAKTMLETYQNLTQKIANLTEADKGSDNLIDWFYPSYWLWLRDYDPAESAKNIDKPILFLLGSADSSISADKLDIWQEATKDNPQAKTKLYPDLDHFFIKIGSEPRIVGEVAVDIAEFIKNQQ